MTISTRSTRQHSILIISAANAVRGIMLEGYINAVAGSGWRAYSAGTQPATAIHPLALLVLAEAGIRPDARCKNWTEFIGQDAPRMDVVATVCTVSAEQVSPDWPGTPLVLNWPLPHPNEAADNAEERIAAFRAVFTLVKARADDFLNEMALATSASKLRGAI